MGVKLAEKLKKRKWQILDIVLVLLLGLFSLTWFRGDFLIAGGDFGIPFDRAKYFQVMFSVWDETISLGNPDYRQVASLIPYALSGAITQYLGLSLVVWEKILFYIWFAGSGLSMYYLCSVLGMKRFGRIAATLFYMLNPFSLIIIWHVSHALIQMPYTFAPLYLGLYINGLQKRKGLGYIGLAVLIWLFTTTSAYAWPAAVVIHWIPIFFYFLVALILRLEERRFIIKYTLIFLGVWALFNFYWWFPFVVSFPESAASAHMPVLLSDIETLKLTSVKLQDAIRMLGFWSLHGGYKGEPYYSYEALYTFFPIILISWLIPLLVLLGFLQRDVRKKGLTLFFLFTLIFGLFGMKGPYFPLGGIAILIYQKFPALILLTRFSFLFFGIFTYLIFSVLVGYGFLVVREFGIKRIKKLIYLPLAFLSILLFVVLALPFWTGEVIRSEGKLWPGERVEVPPYWWEAKKWLAEQKEFFRILPLPMSKTYNVAFDWNRGYTGGDPTRWFASQPVLNANTGWTFEIPQLIGNLIEKETDFKDVGKLLGLLNVKYLLVREDTRWDFIRGHNWWFTHNLENIDKFLDSQNDLRLEKEFGKLKFYSITPEYLRPRIYVPKTVAFTSGKTESLADITPFLNSQQQEGVLFIDQNLGEAKQIDNQFDDFFIWYAPSPLIEERKNLSLQEAADNLPHVRILPDSPFYILIQTKELLQKFLAPASRRMELELTSASKRLKEAYYLAEKGEFSLATTAVKQAKLIWEGQNIDQWQKEINSQIDGQLQVQEIFLESFKRDPLSVKSDPDFSSAIDALIDNLAMKKRDIDELRSWSSWFQEKIDTSRITYRLNVYKEGNYELFLRHDNFLKYYESPGNLLSFKLDDTSFERPVKFTEDNLFSLGEVALKEGRHSLIISTPVSRNLIEDPSFEKGLWGGAVDISNSLLQSEITSEQSPDAIEGKFSLKLSANKNKAAISTAIRDFKPQEIYKISFATKYLWGEPPRIGIWENDTKSSMPSWRLYPSPWGTANPQTNFSMMQKLPPTTTWRHYELIFKPQNTTQMAGLSFFADPTEIGGTTNLFDDVKVERVFTNPIFLKYSSPEPPTRKIPQISFSRISASRYDVEVKNATDPYFLIFSESYHPGWKASVGGEHLVLNGFTNAWYINKPGDYTITLEFTPQRIYWLSGGVSLSSFLLLTAYILFRRRKGRVS